jgi:membrane protease YdiL (CAAX protease family)
MSAKLPSPQRPRTAGTSPLGPPLQGRDVLRAFLIGIGLFMLGEIVLRQIAAGITTGAERLNYLIAFYALWTFAWLGAIWLVFVRLRGLSFADLGYVVPDPRWAARGIGFGFAALPLAYMIAIVMRPVLGTDGGANVRQLLGGKDLTVFHAATMLLYGGFLVPITEELLFRGLVFRWLRQRMDFWAAALISAAIFGVAHVRPDQILLTAILAVPMAWLYERSRSLAPAILMHQTYNSLGLMMQFAYVWFVPEQSS